MSSTRHVMVSGGFDWFHTGQVRFPEEVNTHGDLYVVIGHDANIRLLKGEGHPLIPEAERRYVVGSIKYVKQALLSSLEKSIRTASEFHGVLLQFARFETAVS